MNKYNCIFEILIVVTVITFIVGLFFSISYETRCKADIRIAEIQAGLVDPATNAEESK